MIEILQRLFEPAEEPEEPEQSTGASWAAGAAQQHSPPPTPPAIGDWAATGGPVEASSATVPTDNDTGGVPAADPESDNAQPA